MSATTTVPEARSARADAAVSADRRVDARTFPERVRTAFVSLRVRFGAIRFPAYVSAFEAEHLVALAEWSDCRTGTTGRPVIERRHGGE
jgi:hypothetical protein